MLSAASVPVIRSSPVTVENAAVARGKLMTPSSTSRLSSCSTARQTAFLWRMRGEQDGLRKALWIHFVMRDMGCSFRVGQRGVRARHSPLVFFSRGHSTERPLLQSSLRFPARQHTKAEEYFFPAQPHGPPPPRLAAPLAREPRRSMPASRGR